MPSKNICASIVFFCMASVAVAQGATPPPPPPTPPPPGLPIDNGILILFLLALIYGGYRAFLLCKHKA